MEAQEKFSCPNRTGAVLDGEQGSVAEHTPLAVPPMLVGVKWSSEGDLYVLVCDNKRDSSQICGRQLLLAAHLEARGPSPLTTDRVTLECQRHSTC